MTVAAMTSGSSFEGTIRVGVDLCRVADVAAAVDRFGSRYVNRVYTDAELGEGRTAATADPEHLAARFAAKEATFKVLRPVGAGIDWRTIEVVRSPEGGCDIHLRGAMAELARRSGLSSLAVGLSHEAGMAVAVVVGTVEATAPGNIPGGAEPTTPGPTADGPTTDQPTTDRSTAGTTRATVERVDSP